MLFYNNSSKYRVTVLSIKALFMSHKQSLLELVLLPSLLGCSSQTSNSGWQGLFATRTKAAVRARLDVGRLPSPALTYCGGQDSRAQLSLFRRSHVNNLYTCKS